MPVPPEYVPTTQGEQNRVYGPPRQAPPTWNPNLRNQFNDAMNEARRVDVLPQYNQRMLEAAQRIKEENDRRYAEEIKITDQHNTRRAEDIRKMEEDKLKHFRETTKPSYIREQNQAIADNQISQRAGGIPAEEVRKEMTAAQESAQSAARRQEDNQMALDALRAGVFVGYGANTRLDMAKFMAWASNNEHLSRRAGSTELLRAKLQGAVAGAVRDLRPLSQGDVKFGEGMTGSISLEPSALDALLRSRIQRENQELARYDSQAHSIFNGINPQLEAKYRSPEATWYQPGHLQRLFANAEDPDAQSAFDRRYGPGSASFVLNRKKLNPEAK